MPTNHSQTPSRAHTSEPLQPYLLWAEAPRTPAPDSCPARPATSPADCPPNWRHSATECSSCDGACSPTRPPPPPPDPTLSCLLTNRSAFVHRACYPGHSRDRLPCPGPSTNDQIVLQIMTNYRLFSFIKPSFFDFLIIVTALRNDERREC